MLQSCDFFSIFPIDRRSGPLHQSFSEMGINQMQGAIGGTPGDRGDNQQMNIEPFRSLPVGKSYERCHKIRDFRNLG